MGFNPRTHIGCDRALVAVLRDAGGFNPRTHIGCDMVVRADLRLVFLFQSTHPHRVRLERLAHEFAVWLVSIHAPT